MPKHRGNYERNSWNTQLHMLLDLILNFASIYDQYYLANFNDFSYTDCNSIVGSIEDPVQNSGL
jgi:hypothetical protein